MSQYDPYLPPEEPVDLNPYAAPKADLSKEYAPLQFDESGDLLEPFSIDAVIRRAWYVFKNKLGLLLGVVWGVLAINQGFQYGIGFFLEAMKLNRGDQNVVIAMTVFLVGVMMILNMWLTIGQNRALLDLSRGRQTEFGMVFRGGRFLLRSILALILTLLIIFLLAIVCALPAIVTFAGVRGQEFGGVHVIGIMFGLLAILGLIYLSVRFYMIFYVIIDYDCGVTEAFKTSNEISKSHSFELIALAILGTFVNMLGLLMCLVGMIFTVPLSMLLWSTTYALLVGDSRAAKSRKPPVSNEFLEFES